MDVKQTRYVIVTPVRDEEEFIGQTVRSVVEQTVRPAEWVIVNDGSKDRTGALIDEYARQYPWIRAVHRQDRGYRKWGAGIIEAFYAGFNALTYMDWEFMAKLDGDLSFEPGYFAGTFQKFADSPKIGIGGGLLYHFENGTKVLETAPLFHVRGGAKIYRRACWDDIEGLWVGPGSDTVDEVKANMLGWSSMTFVDLQILHHRPTGASWGRWGGIAKNGKTDYVAGYHPLFVMAKSLVNVAKPPYVMGSVALLYGYIAAYLQRIPQVDDPALIRYLRQQQMARLLGRESIWK